MAKPKAEVDWERLEVEYRAGVLTLRELADKYGITHGAVNKRAKRDGWTRDLNARIQAKADELVSKRLVSAEVSAEQKITEREIVEASALAIAEVKSRHRDILGRSLTLAESLLWEVEQVTANKALFEQLGELLAAPDEKGVDKLNEVYKKVISSGGRVDSAKKIAETLKLLIGLERENYHISDNANGEADKPKEPEMSPTEAARRVAFMLMRGAQ